MLSNKILIIYGPKWNLCKNLFLLGLTSSDGIGTNWIYLLSFDYVLLKDE
jgi:hypothetical protein